MNSYHNWKWKSLSHVWLIATPWTVARQAPLSMRFPLRQEYWSGLPFPSPGDLPNPGLEPTSPALAGGFFTTEPKNGSEVKWKSLNHVWLFVTPWTIQSMEFSLLQGIFPTQGLNPGLPHCKWILYQLSHKESPRILEWVVYPFSSGSSNPRIEWGLLHCRRILYQLSYPGWKIQYSHVIIQALPLGYELLCLGRRVLKWVT